MAVGMTITLIARVRESSFQQSSPGAPRLRSGGSSSNSCRTGYEGPPGATEAEAKRVPAVDGKGHAPLVSEMFWVHPLPGPEHCPGSAQAAVGMRPPVPHVRQVEPRRWGFGSGARRGSVQPILHRPANNRKSQHESLMLFGNLPYLCWLTTWDESSILPLAFHESENDSFSTW